jgi:hypothetical protein
MRRLAGALLGLIVCMSAAPAGPGDVCSIASHLVQPDAALPNVAAAIKAKALTVVVAGTGSSTLPGHTGPDPAYPARLEAALQKKLPDVKVKVVSLAKSRQTAADMAATFPRILKEEKPALIVWQTGTFDAMRGVAMEAFQATLEEVVAKMKDGRADLIFMNAQYNPRSDSVIQTGPFTETMRFVAIGNGLNLFDRRAVMRHWGELGTFDLLAATKSLDTAAKVHDCIGRLLAEMIVQGVAVEPNDDKVHSEIKDKKS